MTADEWRELLKKYMKVLVQNEGIDFLCEREWSQEEYAILKQISKEVDDDYTASKRNV